MRCESEARYLLGIYISMVYNSYDDVGRRSIDHNVQFFIGRKTEVLNVAIFNILCINSDDTTPKIPI